MTLVEVLVSVLLGSLIACALVDIFCKLQRVGSTTQNEIFANTIIQSLEEEARTKSFSVLLQSVGEYTLLVNRSAAGESGPNIRKEPVFLDFVNLSWLEVSKNSRFSGVVDYKIEQAGNNQIQITIKVTWKDGERTSSAGRTLTKTMILTKYGTGYWSL